MTGGFRAGTEDDLGPSSAGPICAGNPDWPQRRGSGSSLPDCLLLPKHWPDMHRARCQDQTVAKGTASLAETYKVPSAKLLFFGGGAL